MDRRQESNKLIIANKELAFQNEEKEKRAAELVIANKELAFQNAEKENRAAELIIANKELAFQNEEKENRAAELIVANKELAFQNEEKENRASELIIANKELAFQSDEKEKRAAELIIANKELVFEKEEKENRAAELIIATKELVFQNKEKENRASELILANKELAFQNEEKENRAAELVIANIELAFQNDEKEKRAAELIIANKLASQKEEIEKRSAELILANKELKKANERFELIGKATNDGLWDLNLETGLVWGNEVHQKMYGLSLADPVPNYEEWKHRIHPEDREQTVKALEETMASDCNICITEYRFNTENIGWINIYGRTLIERNNEGKPVRLIGSMMDITKNKKAEQGIKESEEKYRTLVEQASDAIFITDTAGQFITVNTSACKLSQYSEKELLQMTIYDFAITEDLQKNPFHFDELKQGKTVINERVMKRNSGILLNVETTSKFLPDGRLLVFVRDISERIKAQNEIIKEKNLSDSIIDSLPGIFYLYNLEGRFLRWNKNLETESKYSAKEIRKMHPLDFFDEDEKEMLSRKIKDVFISGKENIQANFLSKTKEKIPYYFTGIAISYEGVPCLMGVGIDFSELKKTQQALAKNENHLRVILQTNPECIKLIGRNGELEDMNPAGLAMIEADSFEQIKDKSLFDVIDKPYWRAFSQLSQNVFKGKSGKLEFEITGLKGTPRWLETHAVPLKDAEGKIKSLLGITRNITERKKTEKEILRVIERYDMIAKATSDTIWDWDIPKDKILYNEGITNMFGYEKTKIENITGWWINKIHPDDLQIVLEAVAATFKKKSYNLQLEYRFRCADESFKYIYDRAFVIYDEYKKPRKMIGAMQDISKLKENEISLNELNENLQKQTKELSISNEELDKQNRILQDIAWTQSHIVRAPLARMLGIVNIIKDMKVVSPDYEEWINHFITSANELDNIIKDIANKTDNTKTK